MLFLHACTSIECGPGTTLAEGVCRAEEGEGPTDTQPGPDSDADSELPPEAAPREVYILAGQSNMDGYGWYTGLTPTQQLADPRVPLYWSGWGDWRDLQPASYGGNIYFGPEVTFGGALADAGHDVSLVKHAVGGTDLAQYWYPGLTPGDATAGDGFAVLAQSMTAAAEALDAAGEPWEWAGFVWMQGESDALDPAWADAYEANLTYLLGAVRELTGRADLPAAIGLISRESVWTYADTVRAAQQAVADADPDVYSVETDDLPRNEYDIYHYDGVSVRVLGARFARAFEDRADVPAGPDAPAPALTIQSGALDYDFTGTCGWEFTIERPIVLTDAGAYGSTYLGTSADLGVWDESGALVLRTNIPSWYDAPATRRGLFWYVAVDPVRLEPGTYRVGLVSWTGDADRYLDEATGSFGDGITYTAGVYAEGNWLTYPSQSVSSANVNFVGPSFLYVPG